MGYGVQFPAYQIGGSKMLWDKRSYGLSEVWVMRESTVEGDGKMMPSHDGIEISFKQTQILGHNMS